MPTSDELINFLHEFFPDRARWLARLIERENSKTLTLEPWFESLLAKFIESLTVNAEDLEHAHRNKRISTLAWTARNILEMSVWIDYCLLSDDHAKRFRDDAIRDLAGWATAIQAGHADAEGQENVDLRRAQENLAEFAAKEYSIAKLGDDFKRVSDAAKELGRYDMFVRENKILSKFAHPTALVVHFTFEIDPQEQIRHMFLSSGVEMATDALSRIREFVLDRFPQVSPASTNSV